MRTLLSALSLICVFLFLLPQDVIGQRRGKRVKQRFRASLIGGFNLSQMDGDDYNGFDKFNPQFGVGGTAVINQQSEICVEVLYHNKGARTETDPRRTLSVKDRSIEMSYVEVPFYYRHNRKETFPTVYFEGGGAFARLIEARVTEPTVVQDGLIIKGLEDDFNRNDLSLFGGVGYQFTEHIGARFRYNFSLTRVYNAEDLGQQEALLIEQERGLTQLRHYYISIAGFYRF